MISFWVFVRKPEHGLVLLLGRKGRYPLKIVLYKPDVQGRQLQYLATSRATLTMRTGKTPVQPGAQHVDEWRA
jgi:hypothetical protein